MKNGTFARWSEGQAFVRGFMWGQGTTGDHKCFLITPTRYATLKLAAEGSTDKADWRSNFNGTEQTWWDNQPAAAQDEMYWFAKND